MTPDHDSITSQRKALARLWVSAQPTLMSFITAGVRDFHAAQDLLQDTAEAVAEGFDDYDPARPFTAWALGIARNKVLMHYRRTQRDERVFSGDLLDALAAAHERLEPRFDPMREALHHCLKHPTERNRQILHMRYVEDLAPAEIAERLGMKKNAVLTALHRIRRALAECIEQRIAITGDDA